MTFKEFNEVFFRTPKDPLHRITWFDKTGIHQISEDKFAEIKLTDRRTISHFEGYEVSVKTKTGTLITSHYFSFREYIKKWSVDHKGNVDYHHAWFDRNSIEWYINTPFYVSQKEMINEIFNFIKLVS